jgi:hypothetical protein
MATIMCKGEKQDLMCKQHAWKQWMCKDGNWLDVSLQHTITIIEGGSKITIVTWFWVPVTSLNNHLYKVIFSRCRGKSSFIEKLKEVTIINYIKKM